MKLIYYFNGLLYRLMILSVLTSLIMIRSAYANPSLSPHISANFNDTVTTMINKSIPGGFVGYFVEDADTGAIIMENDADKYFSPASNTKLFTALAVMRAFGRHYRFKTTIGWLAAARHNHNINGNLYIHFSGDPSLTSTDLVQLFTKIKTLGINKINGDIVLDNTVFQGPNYSLGTPADDLPFCYSAPATSIILNHNCVHVDFRLHNNTFIVSQVYPNNFFQIHNQLMAANQQALKTCVLNSSMNQDNQLWLSGCFPARKVLHLSFAIQNPNLYAEQVINQIIQQQHLQLSGKIVTGPSVKNLTLAAVHYSEPLNLMVKYMLFTSDNLYAMSFSRTLGNKIYAVGSIKASVSAIKKILQPWVKIDFNNLSLEDGAGYSRYNLVTPKQLAALLFAAYHDPTMGKMFIHSLPEAGRSGSLINRMKGTPLENNVFAKTGTMHNVTTLSGYLIVEKNKTYIFSIMVNNTLASHAAARQLQDNMLKLIYAALSHNK